MSAVAKGTVTPPSLGTTVPSHNSMIGPFGSLAGRGGPGSGAAEKIKAGDFCYIGSDGNPARALEDQTGTTAGVNDVQTMSIQGDINDLSGGTYVLGYKGQYTTPLNPLTDTNSTVQTAIQLLSTVGSGNLIVTGTFPNYVFTAASALAAQELDLIEVDASLLTTNGRYLNLLITHTTMGQPVGASGAEQSQSKVMGVAIISYNRGRAVTLYHDIQMPYSDGLLTPGQDLFLSGTVPGGLDTVATLTGQKPIARAVDTQTIYVFSPH